MLYRPVMRYTLNVTRKIIKTIPGNLTNLPKLTVTHTPKLIPNNPDSQSRVTRYVYRVTVFQYHKLSLK